jgi:hypothetical protein
MRNTLLMSAAVLGFAVAAPAFAQTTPPPASTAAPAATDSGMVRPGHVPGVGLSEPSSTNASNITSSDTHTVYAPRLPAPDVGPDATSQELLRTAKRDLAAHHTGAAQEALEEAETRMLDRSVPAADGSMPDSSPTIQHITTALNELGAGRMGDANQAIDAALMGGQRPGPMSPGMGGMSHGAPAPATKM